MHLVNRSAAEARDFQQLQQAFRHFLHDFLVSGHFARLEILFDFFGHAFANTRDF